MGCVHIETLFISSQTHERTDGRTDGHTLCVWCVWYGVCVCGVRCTCACVCVCGVRCAVCVCVCDKINCLNDNNECTRKHNGSNTKLTENKHFHEPKQ